MTLLRELPDDARTKTAKTHWRGRTCQCVLNPQSISPLRMKIQILSVHDRRRPVGALANMAPRVLGAVRA